MYLACDVEYLCSTFASRERRGSGRLVATGWGVPLATPEENVGNTFLVFARTRLAFAAATSVILILTPSVVSDLGCRCLGAFLFQLQGPSDLELCSRVVFLHNFNRKACLLDISK